MYFRTTLEDLQNPTESESAESLRQVLLQQQADSLEKHLQDLSLHIFQYHQEYLVILSVIPKGQGALGAHYTLMVSFESPWPDILRVLGTIFSELLDDYFHQLQTESETVVSQHWTEEQLGNITFYWRSSRDNILLSMEATRILRDASLLQ